MSEDWALKLEYDGTGLSGWQRQGSVPTLQLIVETAAQRLGHDPARAAIVAGRTDAGVHAQGQVAQIRLPGAWQPDRLRAALNFHLRPHPIVVLAAVPVPEDWHARFSATARHYRYTILNRRAPAALDRHLVWQIGTKLDAAAMHEAAQHLVGRHDFSSFRASACQASGPVRTLERITVHRACERIVIEATARSFLHHQVRNIVGTLRWFGEGRLAPARMAAILAAASRAAAGPTAPAAGLCLVGVRYQPDPFCGTAVEGAMAMDEKEFEAESGSNWPTPYYAVIFTSRRRSEDAGYRAAAARMAALARAVPGYLGLASVRDAAGFGITVSYWRDEAAIGAWRAHLEHAEVRSHGRALWYAQFKVEVARVERAYGWRLPD